MEIEEIALKLRKEFGHEIAWRALGDFVFVYRK
jgi:hypothetical protein